MGPHPSHKASTSHGRSPTSNHLYEYHYTNCTDPKCTACHPIMGHSHSKSPSLRKQQPQKSAPISPSSNPPRPLVHDHERRPSQQHPLPTPPTPYTPERFLNIQRQLYASRAHNVSVARMKRPPILQALAHNLRCEHALEKSLMRLYELKRLESVYGEAGEEGRFHEQFGAAWQVCEDAERGLQEGFARLVEELRVASLVGVVGERGGRRKGGGVGEGGEREERGRWMREEALRMEEVPGVEIRGAPRQEAALRYWQELRAREKHSKVECDEVAEVDIRREREEWRRRVDNLVYDDPSGGTEEGNRERLVWEPMMSGGLGKKKRK